MKFFGKPCGWCWCQCVDMWLSLWLSVACWIDAIGRPAATTETTRLSTNISFWKFDELICVSHIVPLSSVTRTVAVRRPPAVSVCAMILCYVSVELDVRAIQGRITYSLLVISQSATIKMKQLYAHNQHFKNYLKFTKKGKWKHNA